MRLGSVKCGDIRRLTGSINYISQRGVRQNMGQNKSSTDIGITDTNDTNTDTMCQYWYRFDKGLSLSFDMNSVANISIGFKQI